jgi:GNAT superfamily N-acetyltransferase
MSIKPTINVFGFSSEGRDEAEAALSRLGVETGSGKFTESNPCTSAKVFLLESNGQVVSGCALDTFTDALPMGVNKTDIWGISCVCTSLEHQRKGHATALINAVLEYGKQNGAKGFALNVNPSAKDIIPLYTKLGFTFVPGQSPDKASLPGCMDEGMLSMMLPCGQALFESQRTFKLWLKFDALPIIDA